MQLHLLGVNCFYKCLTTVLVTVAKNSHTDAKYRYVNSKIPSQNIY